MALEERHHVTELMCKGFLLRKREWENGEGRGRPASGDSNSRIGKRVRHRAGGGKEAPEGREEGREGGGQRKRKKGTDRERERKTENDGR